MRCGVLRVVEFVKLSVTKSYTTLLGQESQLELKLLLFFNSINQHTIFLIALLNVRIHLKSLQKSFCQANSLKPKQIQFTMT